MAKSKVNVSLWDDNGTLHTFNEGDELPSWTSDKVGDHVTDGVEGPEVIDTDIDRAVETSARGTTTAVSSTGDFPDFTGAGKVKETPKPSVDTKGVVETSKRQAAGK